MDRLKTLIEALLLLRKYLLLRQPFKTPRVTLTFASENDAYGFSAQLLMDGGAQARTGLYKGQIVGFPIEVKTDEVRAGRDQWTQADENALDRALERRRMLQRERRCIDD